MLPLVFGRQFIRSRLSRILNVLPICAVFHSLQFDRNSPDICAYAEQVSFELLLSAEIRHDQFISEPDLHRLFRSVLFSSGLFSSGIRVADLCSALRAFLLRFAAYAHICFVVARSRFCKGIGDRIACCVIDRNVFPGLIVGPVVCLIEDCAVCDPSDLSAVGFRFQRDRDLVRSDIYCIFVICPLFLHCKAAADQGVPDL